MAFDQFPLLTLVRFMRNHVMLQVGGRPKWRTVADGWYVMNSDMK